jgi:replicative DNA helicase
MTTIEPVFVDLQAEKALLGTLLRGGSVARIAMRGCTEKEVIFLHGDDFAEPVNGRIFDAIAIEIEEGRGKTDVGTIAVIFEGTVVLDEVGGNDYLVTLLTKAADIQRAARLGRQIYECSARRMLLDISDGLAKAEIAELVDAGERLAALKEELEPASDRPSDSEEGRNNQWL